MLEILSATGSATGVSYSDLFCEVMAFPLVTPNDLVSWLSALEPNIEIRLAGSARRRKPLPLEDDRVVVINSNALR